jgi:hypothetical protein
VCGVEKGMAEFFVAGNAKTVSVVPKSVFISERTHALMGGVAVECISPVC